MVRIFFINEIAHYLIGLIQSVPSTSQYLVPNADIVHSKTFENAIVKLQRGRSETLTASEKSAVINFKVEEAAQQEAPRNDLSPVQYAMLQKKTKSTNIKVWVNCPCSANQQHL